MLEVNNQEGGADKRSSERTNAINGRESYVMQSLQQSRMASILTIIAGAWIILSPLFWITVSGAALVNTLIIGAVVVIAGLAQLGWINSLPSWVNGIAAVWLFIAAFAFSVTTGAAWNMVISALVVFLLSIWDGAEITQAQHEYREHRAM